MGKTAIYPGSFDPFTKGHLDVAQQACSLFDFLWVVVALNPAKDHYFEPSKRLDIVEDSLKGTLPEEKYRTAMHGGLTSDFIEGHDVDVLVRGLRNGDDLRYEIELELFFDEATDAQTVFLTPDAEHLKTSSTAVRRFLKAGKDDIAMKYMAESATL